KGHRALARSGFLKRAPRRDRLEWHLGALGDVRSFQQELLPLRKTVDVALHGSLRPLSVERSVLKEQAAALTGSVAPRPGAVREPLGKDQRVAGLLRDLPHQRVAVDPEVLARHRIDRLVGAWNAAETAS